MTGSRSSLFLFALASAALVACAAPKSAPFHPDDVPARLAARADDVAGAYERSGISTAVMPPLDPDAIRDPARFDHWCAAALLYHPAVRQARADLEAARHEARAAGRLADIGLGAVVHDFGGEDRLVEGMLMIDPFALVGVGPARAESRVASAEEALARARLDSASWDAMMDVERARIALAFAHARVRAVEGLERELQRGLERMTILHGAGRAGDAEIDMARGGAAMVARELAGARADVARSMERLALASGLPASSPAFEAVTPAAFDDLPGRSFEDATQVSDAHPRLRVARFGLELAEAAARAVAAEAWPRVEIGPQLSVDGDARVGGLVDLRLPWPPTLSRRLAAAGVRRDAALLAFEDALHAEREALVRARVGVAAARVRALGSEAVERADRRAFDAAAARFFVGESGSETWVLALSQALGSAALATRDRAELALAELELLDARGSIDRMGGGDRAAVATNAAEIAR